jgi:hypothetical protein
LNYVRLFRIPAETKVQDGEDVINKTCYALNEVPIASTLVLTPNMSIFVSVITQDPPKDSKGKFIQVEPKEKRKD